MATILSQPQGAKQLNSHDITHSVFLKKMTVAPFTNMV